MRIYGPAAAILQIAHPPIEQGVHNHSNFRTDIVGRLRRTLESTNRIVFGRVSEARRPNERQDRQLWPRYVITPIGNEPGCGMDSRMRPHCRDLRQRGHATFTRLLLCR
jgi:ER-bound oxygenase mpaB/B'/Rubber oxygenase, catalytic domain